MLSVRALGKQFPGERPIEAVKELSFELKRGRFLAIVGRSGSGKSTLLAMIGGISHPTSGSVSIEGTDQWALADDARSDFRNRRIGFVFQFASLLPTLRAIDNVALPALVGGLLDFHEAYALARGLLERVGLADRVDSYPGQRSGGEQRRVAIARALINSPDLLLADEPTADLDETTEEEILNLLVEVHRTFNLTLVIVTHNDMIASRAAQLLEMRSGCGQSPVGATPCVARTAAADDAHPYTESPLGATHVDAPTIATDGTRSYTESTVGATPNTVHLDIYSAMKTRVAPGSAGILPAGSRRSQGETYPYLNGIGATPCVARPLASDQVRQIFDIPPAVAAQEPVRLGAGIERFVGRIVLALIPMLLIAWGTNAALAYYQRTVIDSKIPQRQALEDLAMRGLRADVKDITFGPDKKYNISVYLRNTTGDQPIYVMSPTLRGFVQVGSSWQEVPLNPADSSAPQVLKITSEHLYHYILEPDTQDFAQLVPYYMHIRLTNDMLISPRSEPRDDLIERNDNYYVYLKPHNADDQTILAKVKFPGPPPVWIPMPPH